MKLSLIAITVAVVCIAVPTVSFAQSSQPKTRQQVREELAQLASIGYDPARAEKANYPEAIISAQARLAIRDQATGVNVSDYDSRDVNGVFQAGQ